MMVAKWWRSALTCSASSGRAGASEHVHARLVVVHDLAQQVGVDARRGHRVHDGALVVGQVQEHPVVAELEVGVHEHDALAQVLAQRDAGVDEQGRRAHTALGAVERDDLAPRLEGLGRLLAGRRWRRRRACAGGGKRASRRRTLATSSAGWTGSAW